MISAVGLTAEKPRPRGAALPSPGRTCLRAAGLRTQLIRQQVRDSTRFVVDLTPATIDECVHRVELLEDRGCVDNRHQIGKAGDVVQLTPASSRKVNVSATGMGSEMPDDSTIT